MCPAPLPFPTPLTPVICGPTAGGKSDLALHLALALREQYAIPAEIITADAFQVYQGLDIGTAKPTIEERQGVPHHLIDIVGSPALRAGHLGTPALRAGSPILTPSPPGSERRATQAGQSFTVNDWLNLAQRTIADLRARTPPILPIVVGGTHLYIKALLEGLFEGPEPDPALRAQLAAMDPAERRKELERADPAAAARIHPNDARRTIRALEVFKLTGKPISQHQQQWDRSGGSGQSAVGSRMDGSKSLPTAHCPLPPSPTRFLLITLDWQPEPLNIRINARVKQMMDRGLLEEVRSLLQSSAFTAQSAEALGYKQLIPIVQTALSAGQWPPPPAAVEAAAEQVKIETRRFAKNQRTWLRRLSTTPGAIRIPMPPAGPPNADAAAASLEDPIRRITAALGLPS